jgi:probable HAF family extracellular repeat protein
MLSGGTTGAAYGINAAGTKIVGESENADGKMRAVVWSMAADGTVGSPIDLGTLSGHDKSIAMSINANGLIAGESESSTGEMHAVIWTEGTLFGYNIADLGTAGGNSSASAISDNKLIAGWSEAGSSPLAAAWHASSVTLSNSNNIVSGSEFSQAYGINTIGIVVGMAADQGFVAMPGP